MEFTQNSFYFFSGISIQTLDCWKNNTRIPDNNMGLPTNLWSDYAKKIINNSELSLHYSMLDGNLMAYASLKCLFGWKEENSIQQIQITGPQQNASTIAQKYNFATLAAPPQQNNFSGSQNTQENIVQVSGSQDSFSSPGNS